MAYLNSRGARRQEAQSELAGRQPGRPRCLGSRGTAPRWAQGPSAAWRRIIWGVCSAWLLLMSSQAMAAEFAPGLTEEELAEGWISLFDGQSLYGWKPVGKANWEVVDGTITVSEGEMSLLRTTCQYSDYVFRCEFRADLDTNSGVFLRTSPNPQRVDADCYELNIAPPDNPFPTGSFVQRKKVEDAPTTGEWQKLEAQVEEGHFEVRVDGRLVLSYDDPQPLGRGFIALQHNKGRVAFRNLHLQPLGTRHLFNGRDLEGWKLYPTMPGKFSVTPEGYLQVNGGKGQLESVPTLQDFVLQVEAMTQGPEVNSGVFFRCQPGLELMGYECQIQHGIVDGDRTKPADGGTGAIFRRQNARRVLSDPDVWFYQTLVVDGPHVGVWVNGQQVVDWTDTRAADENPRKGKRLEAGSIMLQGHDPSTQVSFRKIMAAGLNPRR